MKGGRILIFAKNPRFLDKQIPFLNQMGWRVDIGTDIKAVEARMQSDLKPDVVMLSWELKEQGVVEWHKRISTEINLPCLVFCESAARQIANDMLKSRIKDIVLPPINAQGIARRIELLMRTRASDRLNLLRANAGDYRKKAAAPPSQILTPQQIAEEKRQFVAKSSENIGSAITQARGKDFAFSQGLESVPLGALAPESKILTLSFNFKGQPAYLFFACEVNMAADRLQVFARTLIRGEAHPVESMTMRLPFRDFKAWSQQNATKVISEKVEGRELVFSIVAEQSLPRLVIQQGDKFAEADIQTRLLNGSTLPFDIFIFLPANSRYVRYLRKDQILSQDALSRLQRVKQDGCFINKEDAAEMLQYCIRNSLKDAA